MTDEIDHEQARRYAAFCSPKDRLSQPYLDALGRMEKAEKALRLIGEIAAPPGEAGAMTALKECQRIAADALPVEKRVLPFARMKDVDNDRL